MEIKMLSVFVIFACLNVPEHAYRLLCHPETAPFTCIHSKHTHTRAHTHTHTRAHTLSLWRVTSNLRSHRVKWCCVVADGGGLRVITECNPCGWRIKDLISPKQGLAALQRVEWHTQHTHTHTHTHHTRWLAVGHQCRHTHTHIGNSYSAKSYSSS